MPRVVGYIVKNSFVMLAEVMPRTSLRGGLLLAVATQALNSHCLHGVVSHIRNWIRNIEQHASDNVNKILVGNKADMDESKRVEGLTVGELPSTQNGQKYSSSSPCSVVLLPRDEAAELVWRSDGLTADAVWSAVARQSRRGETERGQRRPRQKAKVFGSDWLHMEEALILLKYLETIA
nr:ras-related protein RABE1c-like [Ipomoea batatas]